MSLWPGPVCLRHCSIRSTCPAAPYFTVDDSSISHSQGQGRGQGQAQGHKRQSEGGPRSRGCSISDKAYLGQFFLPRLRRTDRKVLWSFHSCHFFPCCRYHAAASHTFFGTAVQACPRAKRDDVKTAILYFCVQDRWSGKRRQEAYKTARKLLSGGGGGGGMGARRRRGGGFQKWASVPGPLFCVRTVVATKGAGHKFWPGKFFSLKNFPPHMCSQNDQRDVGIILSHACLGSPPPPPPARQEGHSQPKPPSWHGNQGGGGGGLGKWASVPIPPPPAKQFSSRPMLHTKHVPHFF